MSWTYDTAVEKYLSTKAEIEKAEAELKARLAPLKERLALLEAWISAKAQEEGLSTVNAKHGTAYWSVHQSCSVVDAGAFRDFALHNCPDLLETRASKTAVAAYLEANKELPPGVNYSQRRQFNIRPKNPDAA